MTSRILQAQQNIFQHHLPADVLARVETPVRHFGINSIKVPGTDNRLPPLVVAHGFGSGLGFFFACLPELAKSGRTIYLVDWLGFGASERPTMTKCWTTSTINADFFTEPLFQWMESEKIETCTLVGHSLGGLLACRFAERHPAKLDKLVLASPAGMSQRPVLAPAQHQTYGNKFLDFMWSRGAITPQRIVRTLGRTRGRALVHRAVQGRFGPSVSWHSGLVADYLFEISSAKRSGGEIALGALISPPFQNRAIMAKEAIPPVLPVPVHTIFGDHDWLNTPNALEPQGVC
ncbi:hypothetical protein BASA81_000244 [Batrachochytrium salamandrivorans]|nr:hypothetical protein BASA81_000244 [Batrachochytrium salamandrivorans]